MDSPHVGVPSFAAPPALASARCVTDRSQTTACTAAGNPPLPRSQSLSVIRLSAFRITLLLSKSRTTAQLTFVRGKRSGESAGRGWAHRLCRGTLGSSTLEEAHSLSASVTFELDREPLHSSMAVVLLGGSLQWGRNVALPSVFVQKRC